MKPQKIPTLPADLAAAITLAEGALAERTRLEKLAAELDENHRRTAEARAATAERLDAIEAEHALADDAAAPALGRKVEQVRTELAELDAGLVRFQRQSRGVTAKLREADLAIEAATAELKPAADEFRRAIIADFDRELRAAAESLAAVLMKGHAINAALGGGLSRFLGDIKMLSPFHGRPNILSGPALNLTGELVRLDAAWRSNAAAAALHEFCKPVKAALDGLAPHAARLAQERERERMAANERSRANGPALRHSTLPPPRPAATAPAAPPRFEGRSWTQAPQSDAPRETNVVAPVGAQAMRDQGIGDDPREGPADTAGEHEPSAQRAGRPRNAVKKNPPVWGLPEPRHESGRMR